MNAPISKTQGISQPRLLLHLEGLALFIGAAILYAVNGGSLWLFLLLLLAPDLAMIGYALGKRAGALIYNLAHWIALPLALGIGALLTDWTWGVSLALIWIAHIGMDHIFGYGFKYATGFKDTHLGRL